jgi:hypothetical protein
VRRNRSGVPRKSVLKKVEWNESSAAGSGYSSWLRTTRSLLRVLTDDPRHWRRCTTSFLTTRLAVYLRRWRCAYGSYVRYARPIRPYHVERGGALWDRTSVATDGRLRMRPQGRSRHSSSRERRLDQALQDDSIRRFRQRSRQQTGKAGVVRRRRSLLPPVKRSSEEPVDRPSSRLRIRPAGRQSSTRPSQLSDLSRTSDATVSGARRRVPRERQRGHRTVRAGSADR